MTSRESGSKSRSRKLPACRLHRVSLAELAAPPTKTVLQRVRRDSQLFMGVAGLVFLAGLPSLGLGQDDLALDATATDRYSFQEDHDPNGIGKFYMGREIARVMGHQGIRWLERPEREREEGLSALVDSLNLEPGMVVADIGAGSGVIATLIAERIGPEGTVLAVDIQQEMLDALALKCRQLGIENVEPVLGTTRSPELPPEAVDLVIMVDVYHEFDLPYEMLREISQSLKPGGRVAFVEYRKEDPTVPIKEVHKMSEVQVLREASPPEFGLQWDQTFEELPRQHVIFFRRVANR